MKPHDWRQGAVQLVLLALVENIQLSSISPWRFKKVLISYQAYSIGLDALVHWLTISLFWRFLSSSCFFSNLTHLLYQLYCFMKGSLDDLSSFFHSCMISPEGVGRASWFQLSQDMIWLLRVAELHQIISHHLYATVRSRWPQREWW